MVSAGCEVQVQVYKHVHTNWPNAFLCSNRTLCTSMKASASAACLVKIGAQHLTQVGTRMCYTLGRFVFLVQCGSSGLLIALGGGRQAAWTLHHAHSVPFGREGFLCVFACCCVMCFKLYLSFVQHAASQLCSLQLVERLSKWLCRWEVFTTN